MRVIVTAGGTGGHIYPALAIIDKIKEMEPDSEILYIGTTNRMETKLVPEAGINYQAIEMYGLSKNIWKNVKTVYLTVLNISKCRKIMKQFKPDIVLGIGGYVTYPVIRAAKSLHIKTFIHEQNNLPGKSNRMLGKLADKIGVSFEASKHFFDEEKVVFTGNPCAERALNAKPISKTEFGLHKDKKFILMVQGSLGSSTVNEKVSEFLNDIGEENYEVLYVTGKSSYNEFRKNNFCKNVFVVPYIDNLVGLMKEADVVVSRAGASSISEIIALKKLSILVPSPYVANNHQFFNALELANRHAAFMIMEDSLDKPNLKRVINDLLTDKEMQINMKNALSKMKKDNASTNIYNVIKDMIK